MLYVIGFLAIFRLPAHRVSLYWPLVGFRIVGLLLLSALLLKRSSLTRWIFWSMLAGLEVGADLPSFALHLQILSDIFLRLIQMIIAPLVLGVLITGIGRHATSREVGRLALKSFLYFEILTTLALLIGLASINISKAGNNLPGSYTGSLAPGSVDIQAPNIWDRVVLDAIPENLAKAVAENHVLQVVVFAILFGIAVGQLGDEQKRPLLEFVESVTRAFFRLTNLIMYFAPFAVGGSLAYAVAHSGFGIMIGLGKLVLTLYAAIGAFALFVMLPTALLARVRLKQFLAAVAEPAAIAFSTSTSEAALPIAMERMAEIGIPERIVGFVIPTGYSFNLAGSCLYLSLAAVFMAQAGKIHLSFTSQVVMIGTMMLTSKGIAGIPRAVFVILTATAASFHLPLTLLPVLLGVDALMDMGRATVNVVGNCLATAVINQWESVAHQMCIRQKENDSI